MGRGNNYRCTKCDYSFTAHLGVGFAFPMVYGETMEAVRKGELGDKLKNFVLKHPEGAINYENSIICCDKCGNLECGSNLNMYLPKEGYDTLTVKHGQWSAAMPFEGATYVTPLELREHYKLFAKYPHKCEKCGSSAKVINNQTLSRKIADGTVVCPCCGERLVVDECMIMWD